MRVLKTKIKVKETRTVGRRLKPLDDEEKPAVMRDNEQSDAAFPKIVIAKRNLCFDAAIHVCFGQLSPRPVDRHRLRLRDDEGDAAMRDDDGGFGLSR